MTYNQMPTCRRSGCGRVVAVEPAENEGDLGWCDLHRAEVRRARAGVLVAGRVRPEAFHQTRPRRRQR